MVLFGFFAFYLSEYVGCSGIASIFCFVVVATNYSKGILTREANEGIDSLLKASVYMCEAIAFIYLGFTSIQIFATGSPFSNIFVSLFIMVGISIIRWISIGMPAFLFLCYENIRVEVSEIVLIWFSGLIRGSVSVALSFSFTNEDEKLRCIVLMISIFTSLVLTSFSRDLIEKLGFKSEEIE
jgi:NhaP-type Na+/H+ or K+/H+ antiporter